jgi:transposase
MKAFLGTDVSKGYADFVLLNHKGQKLEDTIQLDDTHAGHNLLLGWINELCHQHGIEELYCGLESTGGLENNWLATLKSKPANVPINVARLNPSVVVNASKAELRSNVTDSESAYNIASYLYRFTNKVDFNQQDNLYAGFRSLHNQILMQLKQKTQLSNELKQLIYSAFPELQRYCNKGMPGWVLKLLSIYPTAANLAKAKVDRLVKIKSITKEKATRLIDSAKNSVASRSGETEGYLIKTLVEEIQFKEVKIQQLKAYLEEHCQGEETKLLTTIKGIGAYSAAALMAQIEEVHRFESPQKLASYFGLHPVIRQSGDHKGVSRMSKRGRPGVRTILYMCACSAVMHDMHMKSIYHRHRENGKTHRQAIGVIMHKLIRVVWGVLTKKQPYNPETDKQNQQKRQETKEQKDRKSTERVRRLQSFDQNAPISRLASKKRKVHSLSQSGMAEKVRDPEIEPIKTNI